jgi:hypothetical protein
MTTVEEQRSGATQETRIGRAPDREEILRVIHIYTDGMGAHDPEVFREAFHPTARIAYTDAQGGLHEEPIADGFTAYAEWPSPVSCRLLALVQTGDVAIVVFGFDSASGAEESWLDIHSLLRLDGVWKIMHKTATHTSRADWAALAADGSATGGRRG